MKRRTLLASSLVTPLTLWGTQTLAQSYPARPIRWIMPFPAGGPTDVTARKLAELTSARIGQPIIIENKTGANGSIGIGELVRAQPDGYTFAIAIPDALISVASLVKSPGYDGRTDVTPIMKVWAGQPVLIANKQLGVRNIPELLAAARKNPGRIAYGTWGNGTLPHLIMKSLEAATGTSFLDVPYKGLAPALQDTLSNGVQLTIVPPAVALQQMERGIVPLAISGGPRSPMLPQVATMQEQGVDTQLMKSANWAGLVAPKGLPEALTKRWIDLLNEVVRTPDFEKFLASSGQTLVARTGQDFARELVAEHAATNELMRSLGVVAQ